MKISDICERGRFEVRGVQGTWTAKGWLYGAWAVHRTRHDPMIYCITLVPAGMSLPLAWASFDRVTKAVGAMAMISAMRNDWHVIRQEDMTYELGERIKAICRAHGAFEGAMQVVTDMDRDLLGRPVPTRLNGYPAPIGGVQ